jgi:hypothetical protein
LPPHPAGDSGNVVVRALIGLLGVLSLLLGSVAWLKRERRDREMYPE